MICQIRGIHFPACFGPSHRRGRDLKREKLMAKFITEEKSSLFPAKLGGLSGAEFQKVNTFFIAAMFGDAFARRICSLVLRLTISEIARSRVGCTPERRMAKPNSPKAKLGKLDCDWRKVNRSGQSPVHLESTTTRYGKSPTTSNGARSYDSGIV